MEVQKNNEKYTGVTYEIRKNKKAKWRARFYHGGKAYFIGRYDNREDAIKAHIEYKNKILGIENNENR